MNGRGNPCRRCVSPKPEVPAESKDHRWPDRPAAGGRTVAVLLGVAALLVAIFALAASAQNTTTQQGDGQQAEQEAEQKQTAKATGKSSQSAEAPPAPLDGQIVEQATNTHAASDVIGQAVTSPGGEEIGTVQDLLLSEDNRVVGVIIGVGGFLGFGEKALAVEADRVIKATTLDSGVQLMLNHSREQLAQAPEFVSLAEQRRNAEAEQAAAARTDEVKVGPPETATESQVPTH